MARTSPRDNLGEKGSCSWDSWLLPLCLGLSSLCPQVLPAQSQGCKSEPQVELGESPSIVKDGNSIGLTCSLYLEAWPRSCWPGVCRKGFTASLLSWSSRRLCGLHALWHGLTRVLPEYARTFPYTHIEPAFPQNSPSLKGGELWHSAHQRRWQRPRSGSPSCLPAPSHPLEFPHHLLRGALRGTALPPQPCRGCPCTAREGKPRE